MSRGAVRKRSWFMALSISSYIISCSQGFNRELFSGTSHNLQINSSSSLLLYTWPSSRGKYEKKLFQLCFVCGHLKWTEVATQAPIDKIGTLVWAEPWRLQLPLRAREDELLGEISRHRRRRGQQRGLSCTSQTSADINSVTDSRGPKRGLPTIWWWAGSASKQHGTLTRFRQSEEILHPTAALTSTLQSEVDN